MASFTSILSLFSPSFLAKAIQSSSVSAVATRVNSTVADQLSSPAHRLLSERGSSCSASATRMQSWVRDLLRPKWCHA